MLTTIPPFAALTISALAALHDSRTGKIPNWITLPPLAFAPFFYGFLVDPDLGFRSLAGMLLCGFVPYWLFCRGAMGGGDVKLFAALGAIMGFDLRAGLEIQLAAIVIAMLLTVGVLLSRQELVSTLRRAARNCIHRFRPGLGTSSRAGTGTPVRLGLAVFAGTLFVAVQHLPRVTALP